MFSQFDDEEGMRDKIEKNPKRYLTIPTIMSHESYDEMVDVTDTITDKDLREKLWIALDEKRSVRTLQARSRRIPGS